MTIANQTDSFMKLKLALAWGFVGMGCDPDSHQRDEAVPVTRQRVVDMTAGGLTAARCCFFRDAARFTRP